jgi:hypothetical protein
VGGRSRRFPQKTPSRVSSKESGAFCFNLKTVSEREGKLEDLSKAKKLELDDKLGKYNFKFLSIGFFGGVLNFNKMNIVSAKPLARCEQGWKKMALKK